MKCFVTVGTTQFPMLVSKVTSSHFQTLLKDLGYDNLIIQHGTNTMPPFTPIIQISSYALKPSIRSDILDADLVISHCGAGSIIECLEASKKLIVVVNADLMDNHQAELAEALKEYLISTHVDELETAMRTLNTKEWIAFPAGDAAGFTETFNTLLGI